VSAPTPGTSERLRELEGIMNAFGQNMPGGIQDIFDISIPGLNAPLVVGSGGSGGSDGTRKGGGGGGGAGDVVITHQAPPLVAGEVLAAIASAGVAKPGGGRTVSASARKQSSSLWSRIKRAVRWLFTGSANLRFTRETLYDEVVLHDEAIAQVRHALRKRTGQTNESAIADDDRNSPF
jgi:hypothetical protein